MHAGAVDRAGGARGLRAAQSGRRARRCSASRSASRCMCRLSLVAPKARAQGRLPSDRGVRRDGRGGRRRRGARARPRSRSSMRSASPAAWRAGIIEYLAEGAWTKRMHAGWAAQSGMRAALLARAGFCGPRTVFEGVHGLFHGFAHTTRRRLRRAARRFRHALGDRDARLQALSVRDHGASLHRLRAAAGRARHQAGRHQGDRLRGRRGHRAPAVGAARRQADARRTAMPAKFSTPYCIAAGFVRGNVGLERLHRRGRARSAVLALAAKVRYRDRSGQSLSRGIHRPHPRDAQRRQRGRGAPAAFPRRRHTSR